MTTFWGVCGSCSVDWMTNASADERDVRCRRATAGCLAGEPSRQRLRRGTAPLPGDFVSSMRLQLRTMLRQPGRM
jgi:hypothetical protein